MDEICIKNRIKPLKVHKKIYKYSEEIGSTWIENLTRADTQ